MTHPLTYEMMEKIHGNRPGYSNPFDEDDMRAAADWQLEQVKKKVETKLSEWRRWSPGLYAQSCDHIEEFFYYAMQELRPQQQEES